MTTPRSLPLGKPASPAQGAVVHAFPGPVMTDEALTRALVEGRPGAAQVAWQRFAPSVRRVVRRMLGPGGDVDDLVQETFVRFFRLAARVRDPSLLSSFVVGVAVRVVRSELRKRRVRRFLRLSETGALPEAAVEGAADPAVREAVRRLYAILDRVDQAARELFVLRHVEGMELEQIRTVLECSLSTAKRRLARAEARVLALARREPALAAYLAGPGAATPLSCEGHDG